MPCFTLLPPPPPHSSRRSTDALTPHRKTGEYSGDHRRSYPSGHPSAQHLCHKRFEGSPSFLLIGKPFAQTLVHIGEAVHALS